MTYVITQTCVATCDTACVDVCPVDCIEGPLPLDEIRAVPPADRATRLPRVQMFIDPDLCICCAACVAQCPVDAIVLEDEAPAEDTARNAAFFA